MTPSTYEHDHGQTVVGSLEELLGALGLDALADVEAWADAQAEPYVSITDDDDEGDLTVALDTGACAILDYPFSVEFLIQTIEDLSHQ